MESTGLRERSKARRREAILRAAYELFAERGYDATTIADIAAAAEVAPRTVAMYFPTKRDIAMSRLDEAMDGLTDAMRRREPGESVAEVAGKWLRARPGGPQEADLKELAKRMLDANPELRALRTARMTAAIKDGAAAIARETGSPPDAIGPRIAAAAAAGVLAEVYDGFPGSDQDEAIAAAVRFLQAGIATL
ncbi:MAG TPA: TetR/AcrR family transcriptional regulator [Streptosporangiaceae bacterium]|nr:TetR/AcrR family transcriptional regulator [Streptosporangiaceae bacterium]